MDVKIYRREFFNGKRPRWRPIISCDNEGQAIDTIDCLKTLWYRLRAGEYAHAEYGLKRGRRVRPA